MGVKNVFVRWEPTACERPAGRHWRDANATSLSDAELGEDSAEDFVGGDGTGDLAEEVE